MSDAAWHNQSQSLIRVQQLGSGFEETVKEVLGWSGGRVTYDKRHGYQIQVDTVHPSKRSPQAAVSVTYTQPDTRGHSNENKLHLKVGELALLKFAYPEIRMALAIGGSQNNWLPYVLQAFQIFYDEVLFLWTEEGRERLHEISTKPLSIPLRHEDLWTKLRTDWSSRTLSPDGTKPPCGLLRYKIADILKKQPLVHHPHLIENEVARHCLQRSYEYGGAEWTSYRQQRWNSIEMSRNYFNPNEASVELTLKHEGLEYEGGVARDIQVSSLLHDLGMDSTKLSEDFILHSEKLNMPVYIQCKASGGGRTQHGKNIQNRTKEQITRSILYSCRSPRSGVIEWRPKSFHWIAVADGDWGVTKKQPLKYVHMLELAGYDKIICAEDLVNADGSLKRNGNPLAAYLVDELQCKKQTTV